jgi:hypothetical protein
MAESRRLDNASASEAAVMARRFINDEIRALARPFGDEEYYMLEFLCECGHLRCRQIARLTSAEYALTTPGSVVAH